jgi:hypothetical protein
LTRSCGALVATMLVVNSDTIAAKMRLCCFRVAVGQLLAYWLLGSRMLATTGPLVCLRRDEVIFPRVQRHSEDDGLPIPCYRIAAWLLPTSDAVGPNVPAISLKVDPPGRIELPAEKPTSPERRRIPETPRRGIAAATSEPRKNGRSAASASSGVAEAMTAVRNPRLTPCDPTRAHEK